MPKIGDRHSKDKAINKLYHDTWKLLKKYRDVVWSLELSVQKASNHFRLEYGSSIDEFLDSAYLAGANIEGSNLEHHAKNIAISNKMIKMLEAAIDTLRNRHKNGEEYYWILYYQFITPQKLRDVDEIIEKLRPHIRDLSYRTFHRKRNDAIDALGSILWGYTSKDCLEILSQFLPNEG